jgi:primary-amine oxidase
MADRGVTDLDLAVAAPLAAGPLRLGDQPGRRLMRSLTWLRCDASDNPFAHPVAGLVADVDVIERRVVRLIDT